jgi:hypothetical protein
MPSPVAGHAGAIGLGKRWKIPFPAFFVIAFKTAVSERFHCQSLTTIANGGACCPAPAKLEIGVSVNEP